jgi:hypothetical protein
MSKTEPWFDTVDRRLAAIEAKLGLPEEPPVDPLLIEARGIVAWHYPEDSRRVLSGGYEGRRISIAMKALKRGMELAQERVS